MMRLILSAIACSLFTIVACEYFDVPLAPGIVCFDTLVILGLLLAKKNVWWNLVLSIPCAVWCVLQGNLYSTVTAAFYLLMIWIPFHRIKLNLLPLSLLLSLFVFVAGWSLFFEFGFSMSLGELWGVAKFFWWGIALFILVPALQLAILFVLCRPLFLPTQSIVSPQIFLAIVVACLGLHWGVSIVQTRQPILDFPVYQFFKQQLQPGHITYSSVLRLDVKKNFLIGNDLPDAVKLDNMQPTVMILVESWGLRKDFQMNFDEFAVFDSNKVSFEGIWSRQANYTQGAEFEDFKLNQKDGPNTMEQFQQAGYDTWYLHGYDGTFYDRSSHYHSFGFNHTLYRQDLLEMGLTLCKDYGFEGICDFSLAGYIDSLLTDSIPKFIYWTTLDSHPPYVTQKVPEDKLCANLDNVECIHV